MPAVLYQSPTQFAVSTWLCTVSGEAGAFCWYVVRTSQSTKCSPVAICSTHTMLTWFRACLIDWLHRLQGTLTHRNFADGLACVLHCLLLLYMWQACVQSVQIIMPSPGGGGGLFGISRSVCLSVPRCSCLGYRHAGCLQLSHCQLPEMFVLQTPPQMDIDPPQFLDRTAIGGGISSRCPLLLLQHKMTKFL